MRDTIVIGTEKPAKFNSVVLWARAHVSQNSEFYIFDFDLTDTRIYIYKDSDEGKNIAEWLMQEENQNNEKVQKKALEILLPLLTVEEFIEIFEKERKKAWNNGYISAQENIRSVLGL